MPDGHLLGFGDARGGNSLEAYRRWIALLHRIDRRLMAAGLEKRVLKDGRGRPFLAPACVEEMVERLGPEAGALALDILSTAELDRDTVGP